MLRLLAAVVAGFAIVFALAGWLIWSGSISLQFLTPYVRDALNMGVQGVRIDLEDTILAWVDWEQAVDIRVRGARLLDSENRVIAGVPEISLGVSGVALLGGRLAFTRIELLRPRITLFRDEHGSFRIGTDDDGARDAGVMVSALIDGLWVRPEANTLTERLSRVSMRDAQVAVVDRVLNQTWRSTEVDVSLVRDAENISGRISGLLDLDGVATPVGASLSHIRDSGEVTVSLGFSALEPRRLAKYHPTFSQLGAFRAPIGGTVDLTLNTEGIADNVAFDLVGSPGHVRLPRYFDDDLAFRQFAVKGRILDGLSAVQFSELFVDLGDVSASASGLIDFEDQLAVTLEGSFKNLPVDALERYWPIDLSRKARSWVTTRVRGGTITQGKVRLVVSPEVRTGRGLREDAVELTFEFEDVSTRYLTPMPKLVDARGSARMTGSSMELTIESGRIGEVSISEGDVRIEGLNVQGKTAYIGFVGRGRVSDVLAVLDREPYRFSRSIGLRPETTSGFSAARVRFDLPLKDGLQGHEVRYAAAANLRDFGVPSIVGGHVLSGGDLVVRLDGNGIDASGTASIDGVPFDLEWRRAFRPARPATDLLSLVANLDDDHRRALGLPAAPRVAGMTPINARILTNGWEILDIGVTADLTSARLDFPELVWSKSAGETAAAKINATPSGENGGWVTSFEISGPGLRAVGQGELDTDDELRRLDLSLLELGENNVSASVRPRAPEGFIIALEGGRFDMRPYLARLFGAEDTLPIPPLVLSMRVGEVVLGDQHSLTDTNVRAVHSGTSWQEIEAEGILTGGAPVQISLRGRSGNRSLGVNSSDAGAFMRSLGVFDNAVGGHLKLTATIDETLPSRPLSGMVGIDEFKVVNAPVFARILTVGSLTGMADLLNGEGISFVRFEAPFDVRDGRLEIERARAFGPALGVTLDGGLDRKRDRIKIRGTLVPAYTLNSVLGTVPLLGNLFVGREGEGVFAINYAVDGLIGEPTVTVNPLSALAPGFLRSIVSGDGVPEKSLPQNE